MGFAPHQIACSSACRLPVLVTMQRALALQRLSEERLCLTKLALAVELTPELFELAPVPEHHAESIGRELTPELFELAPVLEHHAESIDRPERVRMPVAQQRALAL